VAARWFAAALIVELIDGEWMVWVMKCAVVKKDGTKGPTKVKAPGGTEEGHPEDQSVLDTRDREVPEETNMSIRSRNDGLLIHSPPPSANGHIKCFYLVERSAMVGTMRTEEIIIGNDWMSAPYLISLEEAQTVLFGEHGVAAGKALKRLRSLVHA